MGSHANLQPLADHPKGIDSTPGLIGQAFQLINRCAGMQPAHQQGDQVGEGQAGMAELGHTYFNHRQLTEVIEAEAAQHVIYVVCGMHVNMEIVGVFLQVVIEGGIGKEVDVVAHGLQGGRIGVAEAAPGNRQQALTVVGPAEKALVDQFLAS